MKQSSVSHCLGSGAQNGGLFFGKKVLGRWHFSGEHMLVDKLPQYSQCSGTRKATYGVSVVVATAPESPVVAVAGLISSLDTLSFRGDNPRV
mmetsp:Transcript_27866/g.52261  ORF Transcript_27866/g.52261 Transcript_27866/m.52261 type:complete len:92 (+) Transcript_27866:349-624(+)